MSVNPGPTASRPVQSVRGMGKRAHPSAPVPSKPCQVDDVREEMQMLSAGADEVAPESGGSPSGPAPMFNVPDVSACVY